jgi:hypothetical protein
MARGKYLRDHQIRHMFTRGQIFLDDFCPLKENLSAHLEASLSYSPLGGIALVRARLFQLHPCLQSITTFHLTN